MGDVVIVGVRFKIDSVAVRIDCVIRDVVCRAGREVDAVIGIPVDGVVLNSQVVGICVGIEATIRVISKCVSYEEIVIASGIHPYTILPVAVGGVVDVLIIRCAVDVKSVLAVAIGGVIG